MLYLIQLVMGMTLGTAQAAVDCSAIDLSGAYVEKNSFMEKEYDPKQPIEKQYDETYVSVVSYQLTRSASGSYQFKFVEVDEAYAALLKAVLGIEAAEVAADYQKFEQVPGTLTVSNDQCVLTFEGEVLGTYVSDSKTFYRLDANSSEGKTTTTISFIKKAESNVDDDVFNP